MNKVISVLLQSKSAVIVVVAQANADAMTGPAIPLHNTVIKLLYTNR